MPYKDPEKQKAAVKKAHAQWNRVTLNFLPCDDELYRRLVQISSQSGLSISALVKRNLYDIYFPDR